MAEFNSYLLGKARKSVGNLTIVYAKGKNIVRAKVFGRKDNPTPEVLVQRMKVRLLGKFARRILPVIRKGFAGVGNGTAYNAFMCQHETGDGGREHDRKHRLRRFATVIGFAVYAPGGSGPRWESGSISFPPDGGRGGRRFCRIGR